MDSGNSSSIQSSSAGDEEHDSRPESISSFLSPPTSLTFASLLHHQHNHPPPPPTSSFDPLFSYLDAFVRPPANSHPILNLDMSWAPGLSSSDHPNCTDAGSRVTPAPPRSYASIPSPIGPSRATHAGDIHISLLPSPPSSSSQQHSAAPPSDPRANAAAPPRGSKKRSRPSKRAPPTVLTTDTSNFRAMVQEFTGIPSPPFPSLAFPRPRLDLFHAATSPAGRSAGIPDGGPHYLLRPFAQKAPVVSFGPSVSGSSLASSSAPSTVGDPVGSTASATAIAADARGTHANTSIATPVACNTSIRTASIGNSYPLPSDLRLGDQQHNLLNLLNFPSLIPPSLPMKYNSLDVPSLGTKEATKEPPPPMSSPAAAAYAMVGGPGHGRPNEGTSSLRGGGGHTGGDDATRWLDGSRSTGSGDPGQFGATDGDLQLGNSSLLNCTGAAPPDHPADGGSENVSARGEGLVDSWICSSD